MTASTIKTYKHYLKKGKREIAHHVLATHNAIQRFQGLLSGKTSVLILCEDCGALPENHIDVLEMNHHGQCLMCAAFKEDEYVADNYVGNLINFEDSYTQLRMARGEL